MLKMLKLETRLPLINSGLLALIILINLCLIATPFAPATVYKLKNHNGKAAKRLSQQIHQPVLDNKNQPNGVVIPAMALDQSIYEGKDTYAVLNKGIWRWPAGSTPDKGSNTILIGHRFTYTNPTGVFYFLDKVKAGDEIGVTWNNQKYLYKVFKVQVVPPQQTDILNPTTQPTLTLYTCTPIWWPKERLVVSAGLETNKL